jgi:hypothetical protein
MNGRLVAWGLILGLGVVTIALVARPDRSRQETARVELFPTKPGDKAARGERDAGVAIPVRPPRAHRLPTEPVKRAADVPPPPDATPDGSKSALLKDMPVPPDAAKPKKEPKPLERDALAYVGADPLAEAIWLNAINSADVSAHDRSDLIEDLNEDGFADPKNLTPDDLPLIVNRLELIEREAPFAMDDVNAAAFAEAYKDLVKMYAKVTGQ